MADNQTQNDADREGDRVGPTLHKHERGGAIRLGRKSGEGLIGNTTAQQKDRGERRLFRVSEFFGKHRLEKTGAGRHCATKNRRAFVRGEVGGGG